MTKKLSGLIIFIILTACSQGAMLDKLSSPEDRAVGQKFIFDLEAANYQGIISVLTPEVRNEAEKVLPKMRSILPPVASKNFKLVDAGFNTMIGTGNAGTIRRSYLMYGIDNGDRHAVVRIGILRNGTSAEVTDFNVNSVPQPVNELNQFTFSGKSLLHYVVLSFSVLSILTITVALILIARTKGLKWKWLWIVGALFGVGKVAIDWTSGGLSFSPINIQLFGAFALKSGILAPWQVGFGIPVIAILFLFRRKAITTPPAADQEYPENPAHSA